MESLRLNPIPLGRVNLALPAPTSSATNEEDGSQVQIRKPPPRKGSRFEVVKAPDSYEGTTTSAEGTGEGAGAAVPPVRQRVSAPAGASPDIVVSPTSDTEDVTKNKSVGVVDLFLKLNWTRAGGQQSSQVHFEEDQLAKYETVEPCSRPFILNLFNCNGS